VNWKAGIMAVTGGAAMAMGCSPPRSADSDTAQKGLAHKAREWRAPIVATTSNRDVLSYMGSPSGFFQVADGCLAFIDVAGARHTPVFGRRGGGPVPGPDGLIWGGRKIRYGEKLITSGGSAPRNLEINEEARQNCPSPFLVIGSFLPRSKQELHEMLARRRAAAPKSD
jgi:hypothetical protein